MSPTLTDANQAVADPSDGLAALERRGSTAETFGIPLAVLPVACFHVSQLVVDTYLGQRWAKHK